ncbi:hypothetical protein BDV39DRAFT_199651 [Aspergillus sergii]|uniref:Methyltransferase type 11 domain-containing protein n=1 Tax=Aspergillus sergii TaxID=1034303 RepID=A0A5N6XIC1_9EURO|nr:hypothetical protein BDV39DRAFT_199651 [Aspergillus sergii]
MNIEPGLWGLGYDLFRDHDRMRARFIQGDFLTMQEDPLCHIQGKADVVIAAQFLHLFGWDNQLPATKRIVGLSKPGTILVGYHQGRRRTREYIRFWGMMFYHNLASLTKLWGMVQRDTNTQWAVHAREVDLRNGGWKRRMYNGYQTTDKDSIL